MAQQTNKHLSERTFDIGDFVVPKLQPYRKVTARQQAYHKLTPRFYGPFKILDRIGHVVYKLELPNSARIHDVFHVSQS